MTTMEFLSINPIDQVSNQVFDHPYDPPYLLDHEVSVPCKSTIYGLVMSFLPTRFFPKLPTEGAKVSLHKGDGEMVLRCADDQKLRVAVQILSDLIQETQIFATGVDLPIDTKLGSALIGVKGSRIQGLRARLLLRLKELDPEDIYRGAPVALTVQGDTFRVRCPQILLDDSLEVIRDYIATVTERERVRREEREDREREMRSPSRTIPRVQGPLLRPVT